METSLTNTSEQSENLFDKTHHNFHIGLYSPSKNTNNWVFVDGSAYDFNNWNSGTKYSLIWDFSWNYDSIARELLNFFKDEHRYRTDLGEPSGSRWYIAVHVSDGKWITVSNSASIPFVCSAASNNTSPANTTVAPMTTMSSGSKNIKCMNWF